MTAPTANDLIKDLAKVLATSFDGLRNHLDGAKKHAKSSPILTATDGAAWQAWRSNFELVVTINGWDNKRARLEAASSMNGAAKAYVAHIPHKAGLGIVPDVRLLLDAYEAFFMPTGSADVARIAFDAARQTEEETITAWHARLRNLHSRAFPDVAAADRETDATLMDRFAIGQIDETICDLLLDHRPTTYSDCLSKATLKCANRITKNARRSATDTESPALLAISANQMAELCALSPPSTSSNNSSYSKRPPFRPNSRFNNRRPPHCYFCKKIGHVKKDCEGFKKSPQYNPNHPHQARKNSFRNYKSHSSNNKSMNNMVQDLLTEMRSLSNNSEQQSENC